MQPLDPSSRASSSPICSRMSTHRAGTHPLFPPSMPPAPNPRDGAGTAGTICWEQPPAQRPDLPLPPWDTSSWHVPPPLLSPAFWPPLATRPPPPRSPPSHCALPWPQPAGTLLPLPWARWHRGCWLGTAGPPPSCQDVRDPRCRRRPAPLWHFLAPLARCWWPWRSPRIKSGRPGRWRCPRLPPAPPRQPLKPPDQQTRGSQPGFWGAQGSQCPWTPRFQGTELQG